MRDIRHPQVPCRSAITAKPNFSVGLLSSKLLARAAAKTIFIVLTIGLASFKVYAETQSALHLQLIEQAQVLQNSGYKKKALPYLKEALVASKDLPLSAQLDTKMQLARLYYETGEYGLSLMILAEIEAETKDSVFLLPAYNTIAANYSTLNNPKKASEYFSRAKTLALTEGNQEAALTLLANAIRHEIDNEKKRLVLPLLEESWQLSALDGRHKNNSRSIDSRQLDISLANLYYRASTELDVDAIWLDRALVLLATMQLEPKDIDATRLLSYKLGYQSSIVGALGQYDESRALAQSAAFHAHSINAYEISYLWEWQIARLLASAGESDKAISRYQIAIDNLEKVRNELIDGSPFTFHQKIKPLYNELSDLLLRQARLSEGDDNQYQLNHVQQILEQAKSAELQDYFQNDCVIPDDTINLNEIEQATAVVYPVILEDRLEVLVNVGNKVHQFTSPINSADLTVLVNEFRDHLQEFQGDDEYLELGQELYEVLFENLEPLLAQQQVTTILVIPDGVLRTIPMSAVYDGEFFLIERFAIATTPGVSLTMQSPLVVQQSSLFAGGVSDAVQGFAGLPGVSRELQNLQENYGASIVQNNEFHRESITSQLNSNNYSIVHIATHGHFDSNPQKSFLLTYDGQLTMDILEQSIASRKFSAEPLELLVLSACESAAGDSRAALGLAGVALKAGARSAMATLWQISDAATVEIIDGFYKNVANPDISKAEALQIAQVHLIRNTPYNHPNEWAPFLLIGNWL